MFLNLQDKGLLLRIDTQALKVLDTWNVAARAASHRRWTWTGRTSACSSDVAAALFAAVDGNTGKVITTLPIGPGVDALEFDPAKGLIYVASGGDGTLSIFHEDTPDTYSLVEKVTD